MLKVFVDSCSSIKQDEKAEYNVEIFPLRYLMGDREYLDGIDMSIDEFYSLLIEQNLFPKTSLPNLDELRQRVERITDDGDEVLIITLSSGLSGTFNAINSLFKDNEKVTVIDSLSAVGGVKLIVKEINKYRDKPTQFIVEKVKKLIPRIRILAIPQTLDYLLRGGRLSKKQWAIGSVLQIKPVITVTDGNVEVYAKKIGLRNAMKFIAAKVAELADCNYEIVPSYTYDDENLKQLISITDKRVCSAMGKPDNVDPVIACHWGPFAFGYVFIEKLVNKA
ncbi:MAG: DegV family protein [Candidatus Coproplasma sp.]